MNLIRLTFLPMLLVLGVTAPAFFHQRPIEYGSTSELRGITKLFVDTGMYKEVQDTIVRAIQKKLPALTVVSRPEDASIHLRYTLESEFGNVIGVPGRDPVKVGVGRVIKILDEGRVRILLEYREPRYGIKFGKRNPPMDFAKEFIKAYQRADEKK